MYHQPDSLPIAEYGDWGPTQMGVLKHGCRRGKSVTFCPRSTSAPSCGSLDKSKKSRPFLQPSRNLDSLGTSSKDRLAAVGKIRNDSHALARLEPRMRQIDQFQYQFRLLLVRQSLRLHLGLRWPPKPSSIGQAEHSVVYCRKSYSQANDDETDAVSRLFGMLWGRAVVLPTGTADMPAAVLIKGVVKYHEDLDSFCDQDLDQNSEEAVGHHICAPLPFPQEAVDSGEMPGLVKLHGQYDLAYGVLAHGEHPSDNERHEDTETRSAEAGPETNLVNPKWICYVPFHLGVPPSPSVFSHNGVCAERLGSSSILRKPDQIKGNKKHESIVEKTGREMHPQRYQDTKNTE
jgi:hypothetical protein